MKEKFVSKALEANLAETRYKDIKIPADYQFFISLSKKYYGINKRANDCVVEFHHPFSNKKFVAEELRGILLTDFWFYIGLEEADKALKIPLKLIQELLLSCDKAELKVMIIRTILEFVQKLSKEEKQHVELIKTCFGTLEIGFQADSRSFIMASKYIKRYLSQIADDVEFKDQILLFTKEVYTENTKFWQETSMIEDWLKQEKDILKSDTTLLKNEIGHDWFSNLSQQITITENWQDLVDQIHVC